MARCILIGVGGTGAKCIEAYVHMAAAGLGPARVMIGLVDQDDSNGNVTRTRELIADYRRVRQQLRSDRHQLGDSNLFGVDLPFIDDVWTPVPQKNRKLGDIFGALPEGDADLMQALFNEPQRGMVLDQGFRGHPAVGAAAIESRLAEGDGGPFWTSIGSEMARADNAEKVLVFVVGSIFGGTGAAGFPTISKELRRRVESSNRQSSISIGGALLLPYFQVMPPADATATSEQPIAPATQFLKQTQSALKYYRRLLAADQRIWDKLFLLGWDPLLELPVFSTGGDAQANPPLIPEWYAAIAANEFLEDASTLDDGAIRVDRRAADAVVWNDLPDNQRVRRRLGQFLRFAIAYRSFYSAAVAVAKPEVEPQAWFQRLVAPALQGIDDKTRKDLVNGIMSFCEKTLVWAATSVAGSETEEQKVRLLRADLFALDTSTADDLKQLRTDLDARGLEQFSELIAEGRGPSLDSIFRRMCYAPVRRASAGNEQATREQTGLGIFCARLHEACA